MLNVLTLGRSDGGTEAELGFDPHNKTHHDEWRIPMSRQIAEEINRAIRSTERVEPDPAQIEALAYQLWVQRGCPIGSDQDDWYRAEEELKNDYKSVRRAA